ncbi:hypothetical protein B0H16DRAFT_1717450 [Mycena metata]|uniref:CBM1 domain-containing protein n=1 Tax=Mycena metata TaxID=1033252 RepID=A0AAD7JK71_9AGAR|nr:hypothetical protein B0H16DRAFT_1717450 [Mycena metata]
MVSLNSLLPFVISAAIVSSRAAAIQSLPRETGLSARQTCTALWAGCTSSIWWAPDCCEGAVCTVLNEFWSQCLAPATSTAST